MEISLEKKGDLQVLAVKGKIRLQNWRVLDKHLAALRAKGQHWLAMDLSEVTMICSTGVGSILHNVRLFREGRGELMLVCGNGYMQDVFQTFGLEAFRDECFFTDWPALEKRLRARGAAASA